MKSALAPIRTTVIGGIVFLLPAVFLIFLGTKAIDLMRMLSQPAIRRFEADSILGIAAIDLIAIALTIFVCFLAGLIARSRVGARMYASLDRRLLSIVPQYSFVKSLTPGSSAADLERTLKPVLVHFDDAAQMAFLAEMPETGLATVFVPGSPNPWSGAVMHVERDRVERLNAQLSEVVRSLRALGQNASEVLAKRDERR